MGLGVREEEIAPGQHLLAKGVITEALLAVDAEGVGVAGVGGLSGELRVAGQVHLVLEGDDLRRVRQLQPSCEVHQHLFTTKSKPSDACTKVSTVRCAPRRYDSRTSPSVMSGATTFEPKTWNALSSAKYASK